VKTSEPQSLTGMKKRLLQEADILMKYSATCVQQVNLILPADFFAFLM